VPEWLWWVVVVGGILAGGLTVGLVGFCAAAIAYFKARFLPQIVRVFEEKPLFIVPRGEPVAGAEDVTFPTAGGLNLRGCYLRTNGPRKGVVLFGGEFGSNRWAAVGYCAALVEAGYDVFAYEPRNQGESDRDPTYNPLQWVTDRDVADYQAALAYLKGRPDAPAGGVGLFGISKGGSTGLMAAAADPWVRCVATDGAYATYTTMLPYMRRWVAIYSPNKRIQAALPDWVYGRVGKAATAKVSAMRGVRFPSGERAFRRFRGPLLMVHGGADAYIKPAMAETLFGLARSRAKELWVVPGAKHNQAAQVAADEYNRRLVGFFDEHLAAA
jgi:dipeptidyl aminopeptidase/acylaminoacyl peptidase